jgi:hypothetical protein
MEMGIPFSSHQPDSFFLSLFEISFYVSGYLLAHPACGMCLAT